MPELGDMPVAAIDLEAVKRVLSPVWTTKPETAARLRGRIEAVLGYAGVHGWREGANPARWKGNLSLSGLPSRAKVAPVQNTVGTLVSTSLSRRLLGLKSTSTGTAASRASISRA